MDQSPTLTINDVERQLAECGVPRDKRTVQRWCEDGIFKEDIDWIKVDTTLGQSEYRLYQKSVDKRILNLQQLVSSHNVAPQHDQARSSTIERDAPRHDAIQEDGTDWKLKLIDHLMLTQEKDKDRLERLADRAARAEAKVDTLTEQNLLLGTRLKQIESPHGTDRTTSENNSKGLSDRGIEERDPSNV
mgnify:CR=1 FL=1